MVTRDDPTTNIDKFSSEDLRNHFKYEIAIRIGLKSFIESTLNLGNKGSNIEIHLRKDPTLNKKFLTTAQTSTSIISKQP